MSDDVSVIDGVFGKRYGEVLLVHAGEAGPGKRDRETMVRKTFGRLEMNRQATVALSSMNPASYTVNKVDRKAVFTSDAGREVYELVDPEARRWVMQTYSQTADKNLKRDQLTGLASRLSLPTGWSYVASTPVAAVVVDTTGHDASVIQDESREHIFATGVTRSRSRGRRHGPRGW